MLHQDIYKIVKKTRGRREKLMIGSLRLDRRGTGKLI